MWTLLMLSNGGAVLVLSSGMSIWSMLSTNRNSYDDMGDTTTRG